MWTSLRRLALAALILPLAAGVGRAADLNGLTILTEEYPPYNYTENGKPAGMAVDMLAAVLDRLGQPDVMAAVQVQPWARAYQTALTTPNTLLFSTSRSAAREDKFAWAGPISSDVYGLIAPKDKALEIAAATDLNDLPITIGTVREDIAEQLLLEAGVSVDKIEAAPTPEHNARKLAAGRIDAWAYETGVADQLLAKTGGDSEAFEVIHVLQTADTYFAFNPGTDPAVVAAFQSALDTLEQDGVLDEIRARYRQSPAN